MASPWEEIEKNFSYFQNMLGKKVRSQDSKAVASSNLAVAEAVERQTQVLERIADALEKMNQSK